MRIVRMFVTDPSVYRYIAKQGEIKARVSLKRKQTDHNYLFVDRKDCIRRNRERRKKRPLPKLTEARKVSNFRVRLRGTY